MRISFAGFELQLGRPETPAPSVPAPVPKTSDDLLLPSVLSSLAEGILAVDDQQHILLCNDSLFRLINRPARDTVGLPLWEVLRHREIGDMVGRVMRAGREETKEISFTIPVEMTWQVRVRPLLRGKNSAGAVLTFSDITPIRRLETLRKDFVANVSHELKTPLTALRAALETLLDGALQDPQYARDFLETAQAQVDRLQRLIEDLLVLSRLEKGAIAQTPDAAAPLQETAEKIIKTLTPIAQKNGVALEASLPSAKIAMSPDELTQLLMNLLDNAIKFNQPGGRVTVSVQIQGDKALLSVKDTGIGIPPEDQPRIFERFYRVDKAHSQNIPGTGLGLAIVKHLVETRKGSIRVESVPERGSEFIVSLPLASSL